jgi:2-dehydropantoate 2-reductase
MKVGIVGAGAMGSLFGGLLAGGGHEVWLLDVWREHVDAINRDGLRMTHAGDERRAAVRATADPAQAGPVELLMVWCKSPDTEDALRGAAPMIGDRTVICTLQNGLGNAETVERAVPGARVVYGVTEIGAVIEGPGHIELTDSAWAGEGATMLAPRRRELAADAEAVCAALESGGIRAEIRDDIDSVIWGKVAMACPMAPVVSVSRLRIKHILASAEMRDLLAQACDEVIAVANASGVPLNPDQTRRHCFDVWEAVGEHISSMGQDVLARRRTEVEGLCGQVVRRGQELGVPTPINDVYARLLRLIQANYPNQLGVS